MTLRQQYAGYLSAGGPPEGARSLAASLVDAGLDEGQLLSRYAASGPGWYSQERGRWAAARIYVGPRPPQAEPGAMWFDTAELTLMVLLAEYVDRETLAQLTDEARKRLLPSIGWFSLRPVAEWQFGAFLDAADIHRQAPTHRQAINALDARRISTDNELSPVRNLSCSEASLYLSWFGKFFADELFWEQSERQLGVSPWSVPACEWAGEAPFDDTWFYAVTPSTTGVDPQEFKKTADRGGILFRAWETPSTVTFRTTVLTAFGLTSDSPPPDFDVFGVRIGSRYKRGH